MTTCESMPNAPLESAKQRRGLSAGWRRVEAWMERIGERLNPILVKEARQSLKSKQFMITFALLLLLAWGWSLLGIALMMPGIYYVSGGRFMLVGYYLVLALPLMIVVPFTAFRSITTERDDGTFELLTITDLSARQIVTGKLGSAVLQMVVYFSALSPCIAFTYLLRGLDVFSIVLLLTYAFWASLSLSVIGLLFGASARGGQWQTFSSVVFLIGLCFFGFIWCQISAAIFFATAAVDDPQFWVFQIATFSILASFWVLGVLAASGQISFASENRSTRLRVVMLCQQVLFIGWMAYGWLATEDQEVLAVMIGVLAGYWMVMGAMMIGEWGQLSPRARRNLPKSFLGRACLTWLNPGPGTGYIFAVLNLFTSLCVYLILASVAGFAGQFNSFRFSGRNDLGWVMFPTLFVAYVVIFLGLGRVLIILLRKMGVTAGITMSVILQVGMLTLSAALPAFLQWWAGGFLETDYTVFQAVNWIWTLGESTDGMARTIDMAVPVVGVVSTGAVAAVLVWTTAVAVFAVNLVLARKEVEVVRLLTPTRILEDNREGKPVLEKPAAPKSPFDD